MKTRTTTCEFMSYALLFKTLQHDVGLAERMPKMMLFYIDWSTHSCCQVHSTPI